MHGGLFRPVVLGLLAMLAEPAVAADPSTLPRQFSERASVPRYAVIVYLDEYDDKARIDHKSIETSRDDAQRLSKLLAYMKFSTLIIGNPDHKTLTQALTGLRDRELTQDRNNGLYPTVLFYFAGHGFRLNEEDYIAPRNLALEDAERTALSVSSIVELLAGYSNLLIFSDACRTRLADVPLSLGASINDYPSVDSATLQESGKVVPPSSVRRDFPPARGLANFAASANRPAVGKVRASFRSFTSEQLEVDGSPFSIELADKLNLAGVKLTSMIGRVSDGVFKNTSERQRPVYTDGGAGTGDYFLNPAPRDDQRALEDWGFAYQSGTLEAVELYIKENASSPYLRAALAWRDELKARAPAP